MLRQLGLVLLAGCAGFGGVSALVQNGVARAPVHLATCRIKGNVSIDTGERIYHVPGQRYYAQTRIDPDYGERWFCSEAEARAAGWRKSRI